jgi:FkbM family methyltransferase
VGAQTGVFTEGMEAKWTIEAAILIEPLQEQAQKLRAKFASRQGFTVIHGAASSEVGETVINTYGFAEISSILPIKQGLSELVGYDTIPKGAVKCPMVTLDSITMNLNRIDLLKIDVQGAEHLVLAGAKSALAKTRLIWVEVSFKPLYEGSSVFHEIYGALTAVGFRLVNLTPGFRSSEGELVQADALFQKT